MPSPAVKTTISGEGTVVFHDETRFGLRRLCVMRRDAYPDAEVWMGLLENADVKSIRYAEREVNGIWSYFLWLYWKEQA